MATNAFDTGPLTAELCRWAASLRLEDIPARVQANARNQILSVLGASYAGTHYGRAPALMDAVASWSRPGPCPVLGSKHQLDSMGAVFANAATACAHDYDDYLFLGHSGHSAVHVALACALETGGTLGEAIVAQTIANEAEGRLGATVHLGPQNGQLWTHIHALGAALAAGRLMGLSADQLADAIGLAFYQPNMALWPGFIGGDSKLTSASFPAVQGLMAARLAASGLTGSRSILEHPQGFMTSFSYRPFPRFLTGWGRAWVSDTLAFKLFPGCAYIDTAMDALEMIASEFESTNGRPLAMSDVRQIKVHASMLSTGMERLFAAENEKHVTSIGINFSIRLSMAMRLLHGRFDVLDFEDSRIASNETRLMELAKRVSLTHDWDYTLEFAQHFIKSVAYFKAGNHLGLSDFADIRRRARRQYKDESGLSSGELMSMIRHLPPEMRKGIRKALLHWLGGESKGPGKPYDLGDYDLSKVTLPFAARVQLETSDGRQWKAEQRIPFGAAGHPPEMIQRDARRKFEKEAGRVIGDEAARQAANCILNAANNTPVSELFAQFDGASVDVLAAHAAH